MDTRGGARVVAAIFAFLLIHSLIAHAADHYAGYDPADEFLRQRAGPGDGLGAGDPDERPASKEGSYIK